MKINVDVAVLRPTPAKLAKIFASWDVEDQVSFFADAWDQMGQQFGATMRSIQCTHIRQAMENASDARDFLAELREPEPEPREMDEGETYYAEKADSLPVTEMVEVDGQGYARIVRTPEPEPREMDEVLGTLGGEKVYGRVLTQKDMDYISAPTVWKSGFGYIRLKTKLVLDKCPDCKGDGWIVDFQDRRPCPRGCKA